MRYAKNNLIQVIAALAAAETLLASREHWQGTIIFLFQPGEERALGAKAMVDDGLYDSKRHNCPLPDVVLAQHVLPGKAGTVASRRGSPMSAADSFKITIHGQGGHASMPHVTVDPVVVACATVMRWQTIISREVPPNEIAVITVGSIQSGSTEDVVSDEAILLVNIRTVSKQWREHILESVKRIVNLECQIAQCPKPPDIEATSQFPLTINDDQTLDTINAGFSAYFGDAFNPDAGNALASEDFSTLATSIDRPCCYWFFGGVDPADYEKHEKAGTLHQIPGNHSPMFAPALQPTLTTGVDAMTVAALSVLCKQ